MVKLYLTLLQIVLAAGAVLTKSYGERMINCNVAAGLQVGNAKNSTLWFYMTADRMSFVDADYECRRIIGGRLAAIVTDSEWFEFCRIIRMYGSSASFWTSGIYDPESSIWKWETNDLALPDFAPEFPSDPDQLTRVIVYRKNEEEISIQPVLTTELHGYICQQNNI